MWAPRDSGDCCSKGWRKSLWRSLEGRPKVDALIFFPTQNKQQKQQKSSILEGTLKTSSQQRRAFSWFFIWSFSDCAVADSNNPKEDFVHMMFRVLSYSLLLVVRNTSVFSGIYVSSNGNNRGLSPSMVLVNLARGPLLLWILYLPIVWLWKSAQH